MTNTYRLQLRIGSHEFLGEGPEEAVRSDFQAWRSLITAVPASSERMAENSDSAGTEPASINSSTGDAGRFFSSDGKRNTLSLRVLPSSEDREAEAFLILLEGHRRLRAQHDV